jgi:outer membrane protein TolC
MTPASLRTDLAIARDQIKTLRAERDKLQQRLRLQLGTEIEGPDRAHLTARVATWKPLTVDSSPSSTLAPSRPTPPKGMSSSWKTS